MRVNKTLARHIAGARQHSKKSLRSLASEVDCSPALLSLIEHGKHTPAPVLIVRLALALGENKDEWCGLAGRVAPDIEAALAKIATKEPSRYRTALWILGQIV